MVWYLVNVFASVEKKLYKYFFRLFFDIYSNIMRIAQLLSYMQVTHVVHIWANTIM